MAALQASQREERGADPWAIVLTVLLMLLDPKTGEDEMLAMAQQRYRQYLVELEGKHNLGHVEGLETYMLDRCYHHLFHLFPLCRLDDLDLAGGFHHRQD